MAQNSQNDHFFHYFFMISVYSKGYQLSYAPFISCQSCGDQKLPLLTRVFLVLATTKALSSILTVPIDSSTKYYKSDIVFNCCTPWFCFYFGPTWHLFLKWRIVAAEYCPFTPLYLFICIIDKTNFVLIFSKGLLYRSSASHVLICRPAISTMLNMLWWGVCQD